MLQSRLQVKVKIKVKIKVQLYQSGTPEVEVEEAAWCIEGCTRHTKDHSVLLLAEQRCCCRPRMDHLFAALSYLAAT